MAGHDKIALATQDHCKEFVVACGSSPPLAVVQGEIGEVEQFARVDR
jgi:hypothetical protein